MLFNYPQSKSLHRLRRVGNRRAGWLNKRTECNLHVIRMRWSREWFGRAERLGYYFAVYSKIGSLHPHSERGMAINARYNRIWIPQASTANHSFHVKLSLGNTGGSVLDSVEVYLVDDDVVGDSLNSKPINNGRQHKLCLPDTNEFNFMINYISLDRFSECT